MRSLVDSLKKPVDLFVWMLLWKRGAMLMTVLPQFLTICCVLASEVSLGAPFRIPLGHACCAFLSLSGQLVNLGAFPHIYIYIYVYIYD